MSLTSKPYTFSAGATIIAAEFNSNFDALFNLVNGNLDTANLKSAAAIVDTQLAQISSTGKVATTALTGTIAGANMGTGTLEVVFDNAGSEIDDGTQIAVRMPFAGTFTAWYALANTSGSIQVDMWKDTFANYPPTDADSMCSGKEIIISTATNASDTAITDWTTDDFAAGEIIIFNVDSCTTISKCTIALAYTRT